MDQGAADHKNEQDETIEISATTSRDELIRALGNVLTAYDNLKSATGDPLDETHVVEARMLYKSMLPMDPQHAGMTVAFDVLSKDHSVPIRCSLMMTTAEYRRRDFATKCANCRHSKLKCPRGQADRTRRPVPHASRCTDSPHRLAAAAMAAQSASTCSSARQPFAVESVHATDPGNDRESSTGAGREVSPQISRKPRSGGPHCSWPHERCWGPQRRKISPGSDRDAALAGDLDLVSFLLTF